VLWELAQYVDAAVPSSIRLAKLDEVSELFSKLSELEQLVVGHRANGKGGALDRIAELWNDRFTHYSANTIL
jgi:hypothetical protein